MRRLTSSVALLLFASGLCALTYEIAWLRMLRLVFGASTAASAAVLAIFMGGLGIGGWMLGRRADAAPTPLRLYATLEAIVAGAAALSPLLMALARSTYLAVGGTGALGWFGGTLLRLALAMLVLGIPTYCMGGTLPAAVRAIEDHADISRRHVGLLYGANTLGAVAGTLWANFFALELWGTTVTVWVAGLVNALVAVAAYQLAGPPSPRPAAAPRTAPAVTPSLAPARLVVTAAAVVGFAFLLMELVWYRMLAPLLGGSSYTFGLILAVALLGIATGGLLYAAGLASRRATLLTFAVTCALEALAVAIPYACGDRVAILAMHLRPEGGSFAMLALGWAALTLLVVFPAAALSGYQLPLLVGLLGSGEERVGHHVGLAYAANTGGAILGSLAGGFGLIPLLTAPGAWRLVVFVLVALALVGAAAARREAPGWRWLAPVAVGGIAALLCGATGPTAFWRHTPIGAGRFNVATDNANDLRRVLDEKRAEVVWERDGVESAIALEGWNGYALIVNGKSDGNVIADGPTQVMAGLLAALVHPNPKRVLVIGLGTGSTAGWLAQVPTVERVDIVELEPATLDVARVSASGNHDVLANPKVHVIIGDGREYLLSTTSTYDVIFSEPSNPYRAGVASLFTKEFYDAVARRLSADGIFAQWVQAYEVEPRTLRLVYATLGAVFSSVETWEVEMGRDLMLMARTRAQPHDFDLVRTRAATEPYRSALPLVWGVDGIDGVYSGYVANHSFAEAAARRELDRLNTDDRTVLEFECARTVGRTGLLSTGDLRRAATTAHFARPSAVGQPPDWRHVDELRNVRELAEGLAPDEPSDVAPEVLHRARARRAYAAEHFAEARTEWLAQDDAPQAPMDVAMLAELFAAIADRRGLEYGEQLRPLQPVEADAILAQWFTTARQPDMATQLLVAAFTTYRQHPWAHDFVMRRALDLAWQLAQQSPEASRALFDALGEPFAARALDGVRRYKRANIAIAAQDDRCVAALVDLEPYGPWQQRFLEERLHCYERFQHPRAAQARADLDTFHANASAAGSVTPQS